MSKLKKIRKNKIIHILDYLLIATAPIVILGVARPERLTLPYIPLLLWFVFAVLIFAHDNFKPKEVGFRTDNLKESLRLYAMFTLISVGVILLYAKATGTERHDNIFQYWHFRFLFIPISIAQEIVYRSFLLTELKHILKLKFVIIAVNSFFFVMLHAFLPGFSTTLPYVIVGAIAFDTLFYDHPNIYAVTLSHIVINFVGVMFIWS